MFVTFEGPDGAGKSTALAAVAAELDARKISFVATREPGSGAFGASIRTLLLQPDSSREPKPVPRAELFLFLADRAQHVDSLVRPALAEGKVVLSDRHADSTLVYQAFARGLDESFVREANRFATDGLVPDLTLLFDLDVSSAQERKAKRDRLDDESNEFHEAVRRGFRRLASEHPERFVTIDASQPEEKVGQMAVATVFERGGWSR